MRGLSALVIALTVGLGMLATPAMAYCHIRPIPVTVGPHTVWTPDIGYPCP